MHFRLQRGFWTSAFGLILLGVFLVSFLTGAGFFTYYSVKYSRMIDERISGGILQNTAQIFSAPSRITPGDAMGPDELSARLQRAGYRPKSGGDSLGQYTVQGNSIEIRPSKLSYFEGQNALTVQFAGKTIRSIRPLGGGEELAVAELEPELITNLFDSSREKRRRVRYEDLPKILVNAILSAEDKRFFEHPGFDPLRILGAAWADMRHSSRLQGASTLTMQVARSFFFSTERTWRRKLAETLVALKLEQRYSKQQIFELYANEVYLGNRGSFALHGFGEASFAYFGKDVRQLSLAEAAFLCGIIRAPNYYSSADRRPERGVQARDRVLAQMVENNFITEAEEQAARRVSLKITRSAFSGTEAAYFVDMVKDHLLEKLSEAELLSENFRVYSTLDPVLQRAAAAAVEAGMKNVDALLAKKYDVWKRQHKKKGPSAQIPRVQVALVALDPRTGEIKALIGGRDYGQSQLNHALARRQPGSAFKPFVYAAALDNAVDGVNPIVTPATTIVDEPTTFEFDGNAYTPNNYGEKFLGTVTVRDALIHSLNVATVKVAELVGYGRVVQVARKMGLGNNIQATPAVALGAYEMSPLDVAAGYTAFAASGVRAEPQFLLSVVNADGTLLEKITPQTRTVLDPRVAFLVTSLLKDVLNRGTAAGVRARGFTLPAAGKTGTSRDGWFAGFTSNLVCIVWIGFDDNHDLGLTGSVTAAPIWADFMIRATSMPAYSKVHDFLAPAGVVSVTIDPETLQLATPLCPVTRAEVYISGTEPTQFCERHGGGARTSTTPASWLSHIFGGSPNPPPAAGSGAASPPASNAPATSTPPKPPGAATPPPPEQEKKKGPLQKFFGILGGKKDDKKDKSEKKDSDQPKQEKQ
ncbi:MAG TPA: PBP1A family penicillin-binding protein [Candidatus Acidoferrales bacterium]|nr:PBP1A family penicillin-binding protein [Candidatus Acidoferrales bacterium]